MKSRLHWRLRAQTMLFIALLIATAGLLLFRLATLLPGLSSSTEVFVSEPNLLFHQLVANPAGLPYGVVLGLAEALPGKTGIADVRIPAVAFGLATALLTYWLLRKWYGYRLAIFGSLLMVSAPWFLHISRLASPIIILPFGMVVLLCLAALWHQAHRPKWLLYISAIAIGICLYIPGFIWLLLGTAFFERRNIIKSINEHRKQSLAAIVLCLILLAPMIRALVLHPDIYRGFIGLPQILPTPLQFIERYADVWRNIFVGGLDNPSFNLARLPLIDFLTSLSFVVGLYLYSKHPKAVRTKQLLYLWLVGTALVTLFGPQSVGLILPIVVILCTGGIGYLLHLWLKVFPKNPIARTFGIGLMGIVILFAVAYNLRNYYIAWPNNAAVQRAFNRQL